MGGSRRVGEGARTGSTIGDGARASPLDEAMHEARVSWPIIGVGGCLGPSPTFSSLTKQNKKAKICFVIYIAGFFFKFVFVMK